MDSTYFLRQLDIADLARFKDKPVTVIRAGGIGAATVVALAQPLPVKRGTSPFVLPSSLPATETIETTYSHKDSLVYLDSVEHNQQTAQ
jgi:hypothetical protein